MSQKSTRGRLIILCGPSCVGKSPLCRALQRLHPEMTEKMKTVVLYNSRDPRPGEKDGVDYHFRPREKIEALRGDDRYVVLEVRGDLQALDLEELDGILREGDAFFEGNPYVAQVLITHPSLEGVKRRSAFLSPLSREEIEEIRSPERRLSLPDLVADVMRRKLLRRMRHQKGEPSLKDLEEIERRCGKAYDELCMAPLFDLVLPNHDGEDSENWGAFYWPLGDARKALNAFVTLLRGYTPHEAETWEADLLPKPASATA